MGVRFRLAFPARSVGSCRSSAPPRRPAVSAQSPFKLQCPEAYFSANRATKHVTSFKRHSIRPCARGLLQVASVKTIVRTRIADTTATGRREQEVKLLRRIKTALSRRCALSRSFLRYPRFFPRAFPWSSFVVWAARGPQGQLHLGQAVTSKPSREQRALPQRERERREHEPNEG